MWQTFTFLDPTGNLFAESEDFGAGAWTNGASDRIDHGDGGSVGDDVGRLE